MAAPAASVRWGFLGCGKISNDFINAMKNSPTSVLTACAARSLDAAQAFAKTHGIARAYGSYEELVADAEVDVVYIGTIHTMHYPHTLLALEHGKHVLVEKPMAMNAIQAAHAIAVATEKKLFLMEGMWTRFFPAVRHVRKLLAEGAIGDVHHVNADIGFIQPRSNERMWERKMGGGALLDIGIYPLAFASMVMGPTPDRTTAVGQLSEDGVDMYASVALEYPDHRFATVQYSLVAELSDALTISGTRGRIVIYENAHHPSKVTLIPTGEGAAEPQVSVFPLPTPHPNATHFNFGESEGMLYEAEAVNEAILNKQLQRSEYPLSESLAIMKVMDAIRAQVGLVYEQDKQ